MGGDLLDWAENELLDGLKEGTTRARAIARQSLFPRVLAVCRRMLSDPILAEDTAEDIWMDFLFLHAARVQSARALPAYLRMMTVRRCIRIRQSRARLAELDENSASNGLAEDHLVSAVDLMRDQVRLQACLEQLDGRARKILRLRFHLDLTQEAIGQALGVSKQYAGRVIARSLENLRQCLEAGR
jgi:RNA polymerase sigma factor (sigma-70 family)